MSSPSKLAIVDKLLPLLEAYGSSRKRQTELRREMKASACTARHSDEAPCFDPENGRSPWCDGCRQHDQLFARLMHERQANKKRLLRIERLAVSYAEPEPEEPPETKELLELIHKLEQETAANGTAAPILDGNFEG